MLLQAYLCCGANVRFFGTHGLSCRCSGGRILQHAAVNETIHCALVSGVVPAVLESVGVCHNNGKRPDGMTLIPWRRGLPLVWVALTLLLHSTFQHLLVEPVDWPILLKHPRLINILPWQQTFIFPLFV